MLKQWVLGATVVALVVGSSAPSWAWGVEGHRIIARIAAKALDRSTRTKVAAILGVADTPAAVELAMADASTWPDKIDRVATGTRDWHFINVSVSTPFSIAGLCPAHNCVIERINEMEARLRNNQTGFRLLQAPTPNRPMTSRQVAFLIHLVGDVHQPLHAANNNDHGGNDVTLNNPIPHGNFSTTKLHFVWDDDEVDAISRALGDESHSAAALFQRFQNGAVIVQLAPLQWARESNELARQNIYNQLRIVSQKVTLPSAYLQNNEDEAEQQLIRAGIRLGRFLNDICQGNGCKANP